MFQQVSSEIPSKTFLFGEYSVLFGSRAYVLAHKPYFTESSDTKVDVHELSPAGKILKEYNQSLKIGLNDPHKKKGGFGRSTAEFVLALRKVKTDFSIKDSLDKYLSFFKEESVKPSGADLVVQLKGQSGVFTKKPFSFKEVSWPFKEASVLLCHTNNKVETHKHLSNDLSDLDFSLLKERADQAGLALFKQDFSNFLKALKSFSSEQEKLGLVHPHSISLVRRLNEIKEVLFARGCGALGADVVAILINKNLKTQSLSLKLKELNLDLICRI